MPCTRTRKWCCCRCNRFFFSLAVWYYHYCRCPCFAGIFDQENLFAAASAAIAGDSSHHTRPLNKQYHQDEQNILLRLKQSEENRDEDQIIVSLPLGGVIHPSQSWIISSSFSFLSSSAMVSLTFHSFFASMVFDSILHHFTWILLIIEYNYMY